MTTSKASGGKLTKPYRRIETFSSNLDKWMTRSTCSSVPKGFADGYVTRHLEMYPCEAIRIIKWDGSIEYEHPGNSKVVLNYSNRAENCTDSELKEE